MLKVLSLQEQLEEVRRRYPLASVSPTSGGFHLLTVPNVRLRPGWNQTETTLTIILLAGFPNVKPDCFYTDASLLLGTGGNPANSVVQLLSEGTYRWFSWHITTWQPSDTLDKYIRSCEARLRDIR